MRVTVNRKFTATHHDSPFYRKEHDMTELTLPTHKTFVNLTEKRFGRLIVIAFAGMAKYGVRWTCNCDCGKTIEVYAAALNAGRAQSCGCYRYDRARSVNTTHGHFRGATKSPEFEAYCGMIRRCSRPSNVAHNYRDRGICVATEWIGKGGFERFLAHVGLKPTPKHSIDRIDNDKGYEPGNVRWATQKQQCRNKRTNRLETIDGVTRCVSEWAEIHGIDRSQLRYQLGRGVSITEAIERCKNKPIQKRKK